jgi:LmbE family N-acetylglucosaminyl deacetylase
MRFQRTKALLYTAVLGAVLSGCTNSVIAADQVTPTVVPATCTSANSSMNVVAHEDDDILFIDSPTYLDVTSGRCLTTVYLTAGDDGQGASYWQGREDGAMAAYAKMARAGNAWTTTELRTSSGQVAVTRTLNGTDIRLIFLRLPTGSPGGRVAYHHECLGRLRAGTSPLVHAVDATANYTSDSLRATLTGFMMTFHPGVVRTLDYTDPYGDGDHADHHNAAYFTYEAQRDYTGPHRALGFRGYPMTKLPANEADTDAARKLAIFLAYAEHDPKVCQTVVACRQDRTYWPWMSRAYQVTGPPAPAVQRTT